MHHTEKEPIPQGVTEKRSSSSTNISTPSVESFSRGGAVKKKESTELGDISSAPLGSRFGTESSASLAGGKGGLPPLGGTRGGGLPPLSGEYHSVEFTFDNC